MRVVIGGNGFFGGGSGVETAPVRSFSVRAERPQSRVFVVVASVVLSARVGRCEKVSEVVTARKEVEGRSFRWTVP